MYYFPAVASAALRAAARLPTMAVKPDLMLETEQRLPQALHWMKKRREMSLVSSVSEERQVWQVTYSSRRVIDWY